MRKRPLGLQFFKHIICRAAELQMTLVRFLLSVYVASDWFIKYKWLTVGVPFYVPWGQLTAHRTCF